MEGSERLRRHHRRLLPSPAHERCSAGPIESDARGVVSGSAFPGAPDLAQRTNCEEITLLEGRRKYVCASLAHQAHDNPLLRTATYSEFGLLRAGKRQGGSAVGNLLHVFMNLGRAGAQPDKRKAPGARILVVGGLVMVVKIAALLLSRSLCAGAWPVMQLLSICTLPVGPIKLLVIPCL